MPAGTLRPGADALVDLAAKRVAPHARVLRIGGPAVAPVALADRVLARADEAESLALLDAHAADPFDAILAAWPSRYAPLMPFLSAARRALQPEGEAIVCDLVWRTAPTAELIRAFAPEPGRERVRPIEGYEMQAEHCGLAIVERSEVDRAHWAPLLPPEQREAVEADARGAAKLAIWAFRPAPV